MYKDRGLINSGGKSVKYEQEILELLEAVWAPKQVVVMHCRGHQKEETESLTGRPSEQPSQEDKSQPH
jgi:hypothetical protein